MRTTKILVILVLVIGLVGDALGDVPLVPPEKQDYLPHGWYEVDIGGVRELGSTLYDEENATWILTAGSPFPGPGNVATHLVYTALKGDGQITACVYDPSASVSILSNVPTDPEGASIHIAFSVDSYFAEFGRWREFPLTTNVTSNVSLPCWIKVERRGDRFTGYVSPDGHHDSWKQVGEETISMSMNAFACLSVNSSDQGTEKRFDNVTICSTNYIAKFTSGNSIDNSLIYQRGANIGIGTTNPERTLDVQGTVMTHGELTMKADNAPADQKFWQFNLATSGFYIGTWNDDRTDEAFAYTISRYGYNVTRHSWSVNNELAMMIDDSGNVGIGTEEPQGKLDVNGSIYQRGNQLHADYVFQPGYELESIDEHSQFMWQHGHLEDIPKAKVDVNGQEIVEVGAHRKGIVEELEKAHIYIEQLNNRIKVLEEKLAKLEAGLSAEQ